MASFALALSPEQGLSRYLSEIRKFPLLEKNEEFMLAQRWAQHQDSEAAEKMVTSHLRLVAKIAMGYRGYGLPMGEVISEGNVGLMQAVKKFDPDKGFRLATYAMWWIRASIQEYILRSWSLVKTGHHRCAEEAVLQPAQGSRRDLRLEEGDLRPENLTTIATKPGRHRGRSHLDEPPHGCRGGDASLNAPIGGTDGEALSGRTGWPTTRPARPKSWPSVTTTSSPRA